MTANRKTVVLLGVKGESSAAIYHSLVRELPDHDVHVILEDRIPARDLIRGRLRRLGPGKTFGQLLFIAYARGVLEPRSRKRQSEIAEAFGLDLRAIPENVVRRVPSANSSQCHEILRELDPSVVVLAGTRIIAPATLRATTARFINMHAGVTPGYRGVHGGYWALAEGRPDLVGTTVHCVDEGIDTGRVIEQRFFVPGPKDDFCTYPLLHVAHGLPALVRAVREATSGLVRTTIGAAHPSRLRHHPTLWEYARTALLRGVR